MIATKPKSKQLVDAVAYYRMSSDKQEASISAQREEVERLAERRGYKIIREYVDEGISGDDTAKRKQFQAMIADAERGEFSAILCWDQDRFGRFDSIEAGRWIYPLRQAGVCLETVAQGRTDWTDFAGRMIYGITQEGKNAFLRDLSRNVVRGHLSKAKQGLWQGGTPPFGYAIQDHRLAIAPDQAEVVRRIFADYATGGRSLRQIAEQLNVEGIPSPRGKLWRFMKIRAMLMNDVYAGVFTWGKNPDGKYHHANEGEIVDGPCRRRQRGYRTNPGHLRIEDSHEAIIDPETFKRCQTMFAKRKRDTAPYKTTREPYLLAGLCRCGGCGNTLIGMVKNYRKYANRIYVCSGYNQSGKAACDRNYVREEPILGCIVAKLEEKYLAPANLDRLRAALRKRLDGKATKTDTTATLAKRLAAIERKIDEGAERVLTAPADLTGLLADKLRAWQGERDDLQRQLTAARSRPPESKRDVERTIDLCIERLQGLRKNLHTVDRDKLRTALREIVEAVELQFRGVPYGQRTKTELTGGVIRLRADNFTDLYPNGSTDGKSQLTSKAPRSVTG